MNDGGAAAPDAQDKGSERAATLDTERPPETAAADDKDEQNQSSAAVPMDADDFDVADEDAAALANEFDDDDDDEEQNGGGGEDDGGEKQGDTAVGHADEADAADVADVDATEAAVLAAEFDDDEEEDQEDPEKPTEPDTADEPSAVPAAPAEEKAPQSDLFTDQLATEGPMLPEQPQLVLGRLMDLKTAEEKQPALANAMRDRLPNQALATHMVPTSQKATPLQLSHAKARDTDFPEVHLTRIPVGVEIQPYDPATFEPLAYHAKQVISTGQAPVTKYYAQDSVIRWRMQKKADGSVVPQSNARLVTWSDGSQQIIVGSKYAMDLQKNEPLAGTEFLYADTGLRDRDGGAILKARAPIKSHVNMVLATHSQNHLLRAQLQSLSKKRKETSQKLQQTLLVAELEEERNRAREEDREKEVLARRKQRTRNARVRTRGDGGGLSDTFLEAGANIEDDDDDEDERHLEDMLNLTRKADEEDNSEKLMRAKSGFIEEDDDDEEDEDEEQQVRKKKRPRT